MPDVYLSSIDDRPLVALDGLDGRLCVDERGPAAEDGPDHVTVHCAHRPVLGRPAWYGGYPDLSIALRPKV